MNWRRIVRIGGKVFDVGVQVAFIRAHIPLWIAHLMLTATAFLLVLVAILLQPPAQQWVLGGAAVAMLGAVLASLAMLVIMVGAFLERKL